LPVDVFIPASVIDTQEGRPFTRRDADVRVVDAALASAAAPTYFAPRQITDDHRGYSDGGLWANDPAFAAIAYAIATNAVRPEAVALVSVGTGKAQRGEPAEVLAGLRPFFPGTIRFIFELIGSLQVWHAQQLVRSFLDDDRVVEVNPSLGHWIGLDEGTEAVRRLPAIADSQADHYCEAIKRLLEAPVAPAADALAPMANPVAVQGIAAANVLRFIPAREYYGQFREGRASITQFIAQATEELVMVSVNLMTGDAFERILETYTEILATEEPAARITLSLLDPTEPHLMAAIARNLDSEPDELAHSIELLLRKVATFHGALSDSAHKRFELHCHKTIPSASAIMLDPEREWGSIQLETRSYKARALDAFGFEVGYGSALFQTLRQSYRQLIADGRRVL
jgi:Patatin-like phospholipase